MNERTPPLARDLSGIEPGYTWNYGEAGPGGGAPGSGGGTPPDGGEDEVDLLRAQVRFLRGALEDVVALALSGADYKERAIMMHRRAVAALSGAARKPATPPPPAEPREAEGRREP